MMARRGMLGLLAGGAVALLGGCGLLGPSSFRYRMTVEVETPQGIVTGSAVRQVRFMTRANGGEYGYVTGEAVVVDLGSEGALFALLTGEGGDVDYAGHGMSAVFRVMDRESGNKGGPHALWPKVPVIQEPITNPLPMLVTFKDINDPKSVVRVDPASLSASFGAGVKLRRISIEKTGEPVTVGIGRRLGWLGEYPEPRLDSSYKGSTNPTLPEKLAHGDFHRGTIK